MDEFDFGPTIDVSVARFSVGFIRIVNGLPEVLGSGTLVRCKTIQGILTCGHVINAVKKNENIGLCVFPVRGSQRQQTIIDVSTISEKCINFYNGTASENGPDLGFLPLSSGIMSSLEASASVLDLDLQAQRARNPSPLNTSPIEVVVGAVDESSTDLIKLESSITLNVKGLLITGNFVSVTQVNDIDRLDFEPLPFSGVDVPDSFGGMSGGGMWRIYIQQCDLGEYSAVETRLVGVTFWQTGFPNRKLIGHGPIGIYEKLLRAIYSAWPV